MNQLEKQITAFEEKHIKKLRHWASLVPPEELDQLVNFLDEMEKNSRALTEKVRKNPSLYSKRWQPLLNQIQGMLPNIEGHLQKITSEARSGMSLLDKGQRSLMGYRQSDPRNKPPRLDSNG